MSFPDPPTTDSLSSARLFLTTILASLSSLDKQINSAQDTLAASIKTHSENLDSLHSRRLALQSQAAETLCYLSPMVRLPMDVLRCIFLACLETHGCAAWILIAVCRRWREVGLSTPRLWSKVRLVTSEDGDPEVVRVWMERAGSTVELDVEIYLGRGSRRSSSRSRSRSRSPVTAAAGWGVASVSTVSRIQSLCPPESSNPWMYLLARRRQSSHRDTRQHWAHVAMFYLTREMHRWRRFVFRFDGHFSSISALKSIAYYPSSGVLAPFLTEFEISAGESVYYADQWQHFLPNVAGESSPLPNLRSLTLQNTPFVWSSPLILHSPYLQTLTLHSTAYSSFSPSQTNRHQLTLDRIILILNTNAYTLHTLSLHLHTVLPALLPLPLTPLTLPNLKKLTVAGHTILTRLVDFLLLPALQDLALDIEPRTSGVVLPGERPIQETIHALLTRSATEAKNTPKLTSLSISYNSFSQNGTGTPPAFYHHPPAALPPPLPAWATATGVGPGAPGAAVGGAPISWTTLLTLLAHLKQLRVGGGGILVETVLTALCASIPFPSSSSSSDSEEEEEGERRWACPRLELLGVRTSSAAGGGHRAASPYGWHDGLVGEPGGVLGKLVQVVDVRNPQTSTAAPAPAAGTVGGLGMPKRLKTLELGDCKPAMVGEDVVTWLRARVGDTRLKSDMRRGGVLGWAEDDEDDADTEGEVDF